MVYSLIGKAVVKGAKLFLRRRYGSTYLPKPALAGLVLAAGLAATYALTRRDGSLGAS